MQTALSIWLPKELPRYCIKPGGVLRSSQPYELTDGPKHSASARPRQDIYGHVPKTSGEGIGKQDGRLRQLRGTGDITFPTGTAIARQTLAGRDPNAFENRLLMTTGNSP